MPPLSETQNAEPRLRSLAARILVFFTAYLACAAAGRLFSSATLPFVSFWLPSGLMVATLLRQESRDWPAFAAAAFLANLGFDLANGQALAIGLLFATGNCLEALAGAWLLRRLVAPRPDLSTVREVWGLLGFSAVLSTTISATIGALTIAVVMGRGSFADTWPLWWSGDALGVLLMGPLILAWRNNSHWIFGRAALARQMEAGVLIVVVGMVAAYSFNDVWHPQVSLGYLLLPCGLWAAFRFGPQVTAAVNLVGALFAAWFTTHGYSDIAKSGLVTTSQIATLQLFLAVVALTGLFMCAVLAERRKTEAALRFSEQQLRSYVEHAGDAIYVVAQDSGRFISCNQEACRNLGYRREELLQMSPHDIETEFKPAEIEKIHRALNESPNLQLEGVHRRKDGTTFPVEINLSRLDGAEPPCLLSLVRDITERKRTEEALKSSERQYRSYVESSPIGVFVCDDRGRYLQVNPAAAAITGYRVEELLQMSIADITPLECQEGALRHFQSVLQTGRASGESVFRHKDGHLGYWHVEAVRLSSTRFLGFASDITARKRMEEALKQSQEAFRGYFEMGSLGLCVTSPEKGWLEVNERLCQMLGYSKAELTGLTWAQLTHHDDLGADLHLFAEVLAGKRDRYELDKRFIRKDGSVVQTTLSVACQRNADGTVNHFLASLLDITERKQAEDILQARVRLSEYALGHSLDELLRRTLDEAELLTDSTIGFFHFVEADQKTISLQTWSTNTLRHMCTAEGKGQHYSADVAGVWVDALRERRPVMHNDYASLLHRRGLPPGHATVLRELVVPVLRNEQVVALLGVGNKPRVYEPADMWGVSQLANLAWDVVIAKHADTLLRVSEERHRAIARTAMDGFWRTDLRGRLLEVNQAYCRMSGYTEPELLAKSVPELEDVETPADTASHIQKVIMQGTDRFESRHRRKDGSTFLVEVSTQYHSAEGGSLFAFLRDITERKQVEAVQSFLALTSTERADDSFFKALARFLAQTLQMDYVCIDRLEGDQLTAQTLAVWSDGHFEDNLKYALKDTPCGDVVGQTVCCFPAKVCKLFPRDAALQTLQAESYVGVTLFSHTGQPIGLIAVIGRGPLANRTQAEATLKLVAGRAAGELERFQHEEVLKQSQEAFRGYFEMGSLGMCVTSPEKGWLEVNERLCQMLGYSKAELTGLTWAQLTHHDDLGADLHLFAEVLAGKRDRYELDKRFIRKDGSVVQTTLSVACQRNADGTVDHFLASLLDITERKQTVHALQLNERWLALAHRIAKAGAWDWDMTTQRLQWSRELFILFGFDPDNTQATFDIWHQVLHPDDREKASAKIEQAIKERIPLSSEYRVVHPDGQVRWIHAVGHTIDDPAGKPVRMTGMCTDITERKQAEERLRKQVALLDSASDAIYVRNLDHIVTYWNEGAARIYGWSAAETVGRKLTELGVVDPAGFATAHAALLAQGNWSGEVNKTSKDGRNHVVLCRWTLLHDEQGHPREVLAINTDITDRKQLESRYLRAQRMEGIGMLAGGLAHDLNNILTPILMSAPLLREAVRDAGDLEIIDSVENSAQRGADIIRQLLTFARGQPGVRAPILVRQLLHEMEKLIRETFPRNLRLVVSVPPELWPVVGDATQIHQALMNLCVNARDAMPDGGALTLAADNATLDANSAAQIPDAKPGPHVRLWVSDTGTGISPEQLERIFDPFFTTKEIGKGTGLGLATVLGIVRGHGGAVRVASRVGHGTTFELYLPASPGAAAAPKPERESRLPRGHGELILVVDDEAAVRGPAQYVLEKYGYRVLTAAEGGEALKVFDRHRSEIKAVLADMMMPGIDGPKLVRALRQLDARLPILGMTGLIERGTFKGLDGLDSVPLLAKPFELENLLVALHQILIPGKPTAGSAE